ncbi:uncharacterized protein PV07_03057 [Cladophialophora immunda]|uniref:Uncharacterized protein n=1 Tax=Cladophialophora immunda TaxID=569365 RepID=A0A0D1ZTJ8_9EURO|nr:uncharacterized protein PV07_03057 [Cladophialophora immunda]KIW31406.1 hypothetical protein PV07_03057 [Cladophialophora immunda]
MWTWASCCRNSLCGIWQLLADSASHWWWLLGGWWGDRRWVTCNDEQSTRDGVLYEVQRWEYRKPSGRLSFGELWRLWYLYSCTEYLGLLRPQGIFRLPFGTRAPKESRGRASQWYLGQRSPDTNGSA